MLILTVRATSERQVRCPYPSDLSYCAACLNEPNNTSILNVLQYKIDCKHLIVEWWYRIQQHSMKKITEADGDRGLKDECFRRLRVDR